MSILGLDDPWVIAAYAGCILTVAYCIVFSLRKGKEDEEEDSDD